MRHSLLSGLIVVAVMVQGCVPSTDLGTQCNLYRSAGTDGGRPISIKEGEIQANKDFLYIDPSQCENQVCVRDASFRRPTNASDSTEAVGYCSSLCSPSSSIDCLAANSDDNKNSSPNKLTCRALLLDEVTLAAIKNDNPAAYNRYFGPLTNSYFCARGGTSSSK